jgi:Leucine-rich repeat (LRR) protein
MSDQRTYRIDSRIRGIEGPLTASTIVGMARIGLVGPDDRIERSPGHWVSVRSSAEIRGAIDAHRGGNRRYLTATAPAAALVSLRFALPDLVADGRGRAVLMAVVAQHPGVEVTEMAADALESADSKGLGRLARGILRARAAAGRGKAKPIPALGPLRDAVVRLLSDDAWTAFVDAARHMDGRDGLAMLWPNAVGDEWVSPTGLFREARERLLAGADRPLTREEASGIMIARARGDLRWEFDLSDMPIDDIGSLPAEVIEALRCSPRISLARTSVRSVPAWLLDGKESVDLSGTPLVALPDLPAPARNDDHRYEKLEIDLGGTPITDLPESWGVHRVSAIDLSECPLHPRSFANLPECRSLRACNAGLTAVAEINVAPYQINLDGNLLQQVPEVFGDFVGSIEKLDLDNNQITALPDWLEDAHHLEELRLHGNRIRSIFVPLSLLPLLEGVALGSNGIVEIGADVFAARRLRWIDVSDNELSSMPPIVYPSGSLDISGNPLLALPRPLNDVTVPDGEDPEIEDQRVEDAGEDAETDSEEESDEVEEGDGEEEVDTEDEAGEEEAGDAEQDAPDFGRYQGDFESPERGALSLIASRTLIETFPAELMELKFDSITLNECPRLRSIPENLLGILTLDSLSCRNCGSLSAVHSSDHEAWSTWPEKRREAVHQGYHDRFPSVEPQEVDLTGTGFREVPPMFSMDQVRCDVAVTMTGSRVERWDTGATTENLVRMELGSTPLVECGSLGGFPWLQTLGLGCASLGAIPAGLGTCSDLANLTLPGLPERQYPADLAKCQARSLRIDGRGLVAPPHVLQRMPELQTLILTGTSIEDVPEWLAACHELVALEIRESPVRRIAPAVLALPSLRRLQVHSTVGIELPELPEGCALRHLGISGKCLLRVPPSIVRCRKLKTLNLKGANHVELPPAIAEMHWLETMVIGSGPGWERLRAWLRNAMPALRVDSDGDDGDD